MHPALETLADRRFGVFTAAEARRAGYRPDEIRSALGSGRWHRLRRGVYVDAGRWATVRDDVRSRHLVESVAVVLSLGSGPVLSHSSAARVHRMLVPAAAGEDVRLTDEAQWREGRGYRVARASLPADDVLRLAAFSVTTPARTLVDCAREWALVDAVVAIDEALQSRRVNRALLVAGVLGARHRPGVGAAARAVHLADGRSESPLESRGRLVLLGNGLPRPELQVELHDARGFVARVDAWYEEAAVAVEFDGRVKYLEPRGGRAPGEVLWLEKRREDRIRDLDVRVVRVAQDDVTAGGRLVTARLRELLARRLAGPRRFTVVRTPEPGSGQAGAA
ncbi:type IV toxin-antitoxin system AbiEi family antitoxin domain-containing protein [Geodermatophilus sabuli]|uniref:Transcriptional regulator, AbiEi antitoxin, Type IV TA system n=1 Tax=Geodermatophilus sabuli TaxID=1564158 RepID=A0A285E8H8_9ACTN|nr:type IV toxin-antitoxin system AbiEi family antitoxin domain-containing protein [Geodermatophilus sabuli]MBB3085174.1 putative transcriptional regulator of viral defense system [Geodermatophilus sabuli]SNX95418.1 Transcriptional regulator, AbiEi antitoxin, Type IV TA system [Geodermatophilus sabuli]